MRFKLGDKVKVIDNFGSLIGTPVLEGDTGIIMDDTTQGSLLVKFDNYERQYYVGSWEIELQGGKAL